MSFVFHTILLIWILLFETDALPRKTRSIFDVETFADSSGCRKMDRIMNGAIASRDMFPYLVSIQTSSVSQHLCGGTLLTPYHVLTAAHCTFVKPMGKRFLPQELQIRIGPENLRLQGDVVAKVKWIKIHEGYRKKPIDNDIAVIKVDRRLIEEDEEEEDIPCMTSSFITPSSVLGPCIAVGWGRLGPNPLSNDTSAILVPNNSSLSNNQTLNETMSSHNVSNHAHMSPDHAHNQNETYHAASNFNLNTSSPSLIIPTQSESNHGHNESNRAHDEIEHGHDMDINARDMILRFTLLPLQNEKECAKDYGTAGITDQVLCAGKRHSMTDTCKGDSGGPLICDGKIEGIVSFGDGCENPEHLGVYTRVYNHLGWIQKQINAGSLPTSNCLLIIFISILIYLNVLNI